MRKDVHLAALRAASKVALSMAFVAGCSPAEPDDAATAGGAESEVKKSPQSCDGKAFTCDDIINAAFPEVGNYPGKKIKVSTNVTSCCEHQLVEKGAGTEHRWDCCGVVTSTDQNINIACTPWGPPVPPAMKPRALREAAVA